MRPHSVRLLLAGNLRLGEPLRTPLPLTDDARNVVLDSTFDTWKQIQDYAIERKVEALVLNGNTIVADRISTHAEFALIEGLELLAAAGISVIINPGKFDPLSFWKELLADLEDSKSKITLVSKENSSGHLLIRRDDQTSIIPLSDPDQLFEEEVIARIVSITDVLPDFQHDASRNQNGSRPPVIAIEHNADNLFTLPPGIDLKLTDQSAVWATDEDGSLRESRCAAPQMLSADEYQDDRKPGCLLIDLSSQGEIQTRHLLTASVHFHAVKLDLSSCNDWDDAALVMQNRLEKLSWEPHERLRLVTWTLTSNDALSTEILNGDDSHLLSAWNESFASQHHEENLVIHGFQPGGQFPLDLESACSAIELAEALFDIEQTADQPDVDRLAAVWATDQSSTTLLTRLRPVLDPAQIGIHAESVVTQWLTQSDPENLSHENYTS